MNQSSSSNSSSNSHNSPIRNGVPFSENSNVHDDNRRGNNNNENNNNNNGENNNGSSFSSSSSREASFPQMVKLLKAQNKSNDRLFKLLTWAIIANFSILIVIIGILIKLINKN